MCVNGFSQRRPLLHPSALRHAWARHKEKERRSAVQMATMCMCVQPSEMRCRLPGWVAPAVCNTSHSQSVQRLDVTHRGHRRSLACDWSPQVKLWSFFSPSRVPSPVFFLLFFPWLSKWPSVKQPHLVSFVMRHPHPYSSIFDSWPSNRHRLLSRQPSSKHSTSNLGFFGISVRSTYLQATCQLVFWPHLFIGILSIPPPHRSEMRAIKGQRSW